MSHAEQPSTPPSLSVFEKLKHVDVRVWIVLILLLVFLLRLSLSSVLLLNEAPNKRDINVDGWWAIGQRVVEGAGYTNQDGTPTARRGPVPVLFYAAVYTLVGENRLAVLSTLWLLDVGTAWLMFLIAKHIFKSSWPGLVAMLAFALYVPEMRFTTMAYSEPFGTFLLACFVLSVLKARQSLTAGWFAAAGLFMGLTILTRPFMLAFPAASLLIFVTWPALRQAPRKLIVNALVFTVTVTITMLPWIIRNYLAFQAFIPASTLGGLNLYIDHWMLAEPDYTSPARFTVGWRFIDPASQAELRAQGVRVTEWNEYEYDQFYYEKAWTLIQQYPLRYLHLSALRVLILWFSVGYGHPPSILSYMVMVANLLLLSLVIIAYWVYSGPWRKEASLLIWLLIYTTVMHAWIHAHFRYSLLVMPYVLILASYALLRLAQSLRGLNLVQSGGLVKTVRKLM